MIKFLLEKDTWQEVFDSLSKNKLRSILTMVGVWWGILLLISLLGSAKGIENNFNRMFENFATNSLFIFSGRTTMPFKGYQEGRPVPLSLNDVEKIKEGRRVVALRFRFKGKRGDELALARGESVQKKFDFKFKFISHSQVLE